MGILSWLRNLSQPNTLKLYRHACVNGTALLGTDEEIIAEYQRALCCYDAVGAQLVDKSRKVRQQIRRLQHQLLANDALRTQANAEADDCAYWIKMYSSTAR